MARATARGIGGAWAPIASAAVLLSLAPSARSESRYDPHLFGRIMGEGSVITRPVRYPLRAEAPGAALATQVVDDDQRGMLGARAELALLFVGRSGRALGPRLSYSFAVPPVSVERELEAELDTYRIEEHPLLHFATVGIELQTFERRVVLTADLGVTYTVHRGTLQGSDLSARFEQPSTLGLVRLGLGGRWPLNDVFELTVIPGFEYGVDIPPLFRGVLSIGFDFRGGL